MDKNNHFEQIYNHHYDMIYHYIKSHTPALQDAEELTQDVFTACYRHYDSFDESRSSIKTWLFVIANNKLKNYYRAKKEILSLDDEENPIDIAQEYLEEAVILNEKVRYIKAALNQLNEREQFIVKQKYFYNKKSEEIARMAGLTSGNVRIILKRALEKMQQYLNKQGYVYDSEP